LKLPEADRYGKSARLDEALEKLRRAKASLLGRQPLDGAAKGPARLQELRDLVQGWVAHWLILVPLLPVPQEYMRKYGDPAKVEAVLERVRMELAVYEASPTGGAGWVLAAKVLKGCDMERYGKIMGGKHCGWSNVCLRLDVMCASGSGRELATRQLSTSASLAPNPPLHPCCRRLHPVAP
jgi:hypothetical protein